jgi:hypothetical protein
MKNDYSILGNDSSIMNRTDNSKLMKNDHRIIIFILGNYYTTLGSDSSIMKRTEYKN